MSWLNCLYEIVTHVKPQVNLLYWKSNKRSFPSQCRHKRGCLASNNYVHVRMIALLMLWNVKYISKFLSHVGRVSSRVIRHCEIKTNWTWTWFLTWFNITYRDKRWWWTDVCLCLQVCSACQQTGAIMGCFQKGCPRNYHYRCAIQSGTLVRHVSENKGLCSTLLLSRGAGCHYLQRL